MRIELIDSWNNFKLLFLFLKVWKVAPNEQNVNLVHIISLAKSRVKNTLISCVRLSEKCEFIAIGYSNGQIDLYNGMLDYKFQRSLIGHTKPVNDMLFSPWTTAAVPNQSNHHNNNSMDVPVILASIAEQFCVWNVSYAINNPLDDNDGGRRRQESHRYSEHHFSQDSMDGCSSGDDMIDGDADSSDNGLPPVFVNGNGKCNGATNGHASGHVRNNGVSINPWSGKYGASAKPELLSCIKFVGNSAKRLFANDSFVKFITIDDEGEIFDLNVDDLNDANLSEL